MEGRFFPSDIQGLKIRPRLQPHPRVSHTQESSGRTSLTRQPPGEGARLPRGFERLYPACCGPGAARPPLASPRPQQRISAPGGGRLRAAGDTEPRRGQGGSLRAGARGAAPGRAGVWLRGQAPSSTLGPGHLAHWGCVRGHEGPPWPAAPLLWTHAVRHTQLGVPRRDASATNPSAPSRWRDASPPTGHAWAPRGLPRPSPRAGPRAGPSLGPAGHGDARAGRGVRRRRAGEGRTGRGSRGSPSFRRYLSLGEIELAGELGALPPHDVLAALKLHLQAVELLGREGGAGPLGTVQIKPLRQNNLSD